MTIFDSLFQLTPTVNRSGADGIIQVEVTVRGITEFKGILFQAKKHGYRDRIRLEKQVVWMETHSPGGSAVLIYGPDGYAAIKGKEYLSDAPETDLKVRRLLTLGQFFDEFLECTTGIRGMYYEAVRERLLLPTLDGQIRAVPLEVKSGIKIDIATA